MTSWPPPPYPPSARRSSSRSPSRGPYVRAPHPDPAYPPDAYRADWEAYERDRAWANYERERAAYEYSRRGRSRSPPPSDEAGRKRRRSISPYDRNRFEPRPRYGEDYDAHTRAYGYTSPRRGAYPPNFQAPIRRPPADPHTFDHPATLKQFAEWFRYYYPQQAMDEDNADKAAEQEAGDGTKPRNGIRSRWEKYKKDFSANQLQVMFDHHRRSPWFAEKYDPAPHYRNMRLRIRKEGWKGRINNFLLDLESGKYDPDFNEPVPEAQSPFKETPVSGENVSTEVNGATNAEEAKAGGEEDVQFNDGEDEAGDNDPSRAEANGKTGSDNKRNNNRGEEISVMPEGNQVMIRTIPPDIGRIKIENACGSTPGYVYLALGDPMQKRNYYRAGWLRFHDDADMSVVMAELSDKKIEGFKLHVTHNIKPFVNRIRYAPEVASKPDRLVKDLANAKALTAILEEEAASLRKLVVDRKGERSPARVEAEKAEAAGNGDVAMADGDNSEVQNETEEDYEPPEKGSDAVERRIEKVMTEMVERGLVDADDEKAMEAKRVAVSLDLYIAYLRASFHTCYYCAVVTDHVEELQRKCVKHLRRPLSKMLLDEIKAAEAEKAEKEKDNSEEKEKEIPAKDKYENRDWKRNDERWLDWLDSKLALLINREAIDPRDYGGKSYEEELTRAVEPFIKQEDEGKFRCKNCQKLFKATSFVEKHVANKHPEIVSHLEELPYFNNFALDPHRIQPFAHPPPQVGNSQPPPPQAFGLQGPVGYPPPADYGRPGPYYGGGPFPPGYAPPPYMNGVYFDHHGHPYPGPGGPYPPPMPGRARDDSMTARRLSDRISGYAPGFDGPGENPLIPASAGLPAKPAAILEPGPGGRRGGRSNNGGATGAGGPPPPPPPDAKEDPRAAAGRRVSYHDMDLVAEGDVELTY